jgi:glucose/arabinose dehydrogenase
MKPRGSAVMNPRYVVMVAAAVVVGAILFMRPAESRAPVKSVEGYTATVITTGLETPWDMAWGPDGMIWLSERGGRISRVDPTSGKRTTVGEVAGVVQRGESGLLGIALHPDFPREPWVYAMHTYSATGGLWNRLVRLRWTGSTFDDQQVLLDAIPGIYIHDGSRIVVGPDRMLYFSTGDAGDADQAQDSTALGGKILRLDLEGKRPAGNPFNSAVWSWGHRNPQGLVFGSNGTLYETEHGPGDNDEVNIIERGANYGWPNVRGACDGTGEKDFCARKHVIEPLTSWTPTVAISGLTLSGGVLFATSLNGQALWRMTLSPDGKRITGRTTILSGVYGRLRDVVVAPNGDIYICTSNRDGRGAPVDADDRIIRLTPKH